MVENLMETAEMMESSDYKERLKAEYYQIKLRYERLDNMITSYKAGALGFQPKCSLYTFEKQREAMGIYKSILEIRADVEGIKLD